MKKIKVIREWFQFETTSGQAASVSSPSILQIDKPLGGD